MNYQMMLSLLPALFKGTKSHLDGAQSFHFCPKEASRNFFCVRGAQRRRYCVNTDGSHVRLSPCTGFRHHHHHFCKSLPFGQQILYGDCVVDEHVVQGVLGKQGWAEHETQQSLLCRTFSEM